MTFQDCFQVLDQSLASLCVCLTKGRQKEAWKKRSANNSRNETKLSHAKSGHVGKEGDDNVEEEEEEISPIPISPVHNHGTAKVASPSPKMIPNNHHQVSDRFQVGERSDISAPSQSSIILPMLTGHSQQFDNTLSFHGLDTTNTSSLNNTMMNRSVSQSPLTMQLVQSMIMRSPSASWCSTRLGEQLAAEQQEILFRRKRLR